MRIDSRNRAVLVMCIADASGNPRPNRIIHLLSKHGFVVDLFGFDLADPLPLRHLFSFPRPRVGFVQQIRKALFTIVASIFARLKKTRLAEVTSLRRLGLWSGCQCFEQKQYSIIVVEDLFLLPVAFRCWGDHSQTKIVFDAREYYPRQNEERLLFRWIEQPLRELLCRTYLPLCSYLLTVSPGLARAYQEEFGVRMQVLRSVPPFQHQSVRTTATNRIRMVHHGGAKRNRGLLNMIEVVRRLDSRFSLDFYLVGDEGHIEFLKGQAVDCDRVFFREPVPFDQIISMLNGYDIGFYYLEPAGFNVKFNLPNKLFEFIQGRLAIAIGPSPDMADLVNQYQCGFVAPSFSIDAMVDTLSSLKPTDIDLAKQNSHRAAKELCYERETECFMSDLRILLDE